ncbi:MAG TPA: hypothetical protein DCZ95_14315 [Verrucomicrobia bacterium]|nr:MAG: hypothetical protein A2X46_03450 [Lentisphaerae bacterium GWF2_57_35]HBA85258.1 hypothetical protein [Verrucomicrobiota bacterium]
MTHVKNLSSDQKKCHLRNLTALAMKDGKLAQSERDLLEVIAREWGFSQKEMDAVAAHPNTIEFKIPGDPDARFHMLYDFIEMMIIDGELKNVERELCEAMTERLGFPQTAIRTIINGILEGNRNLSDPDDIRAGLRRKILGH